MSTLFSRGRRGVDVVNAHGSRQRKTDQKSNGHPRGWPSSQSTVRLCGAVCAPTPHGLCRSDRSSANDIASIVGGALPRIFQLLCDEIQHHIPSCTAVVGEKRHSPTHKAAKACIHRYQALRLVLKPGGMLAPSHLLTHLREGADVRKFAEPSDDFHHSACLSSVRACCWLRRRPAPAGDHHGRADTATSAWLGRALFYKRT